MQTIRINIKESSLEKVMKSLSLFKNDEIEIINENQKENSIKRYLEKELEDIKDPSTEFVNHEELEASMNLIIEKYESNL
jgi:hypothetical protein